MAKDSGKVDRLSIPVDDKILTSSMTILGKDFGSEPVAMTTYCVSICSPLAVWIKYLSFFRLMAMALSFKMGILRFRKISSIPFTSCSTIAFFRLNTCL